MSNLELKDFLDFSFILTKDCYMYMLEPYEKDTKDNRDIMGQSSLTSSRYPNQPWCQEFYFKKNNTDYSTLVTEPYYSTAQQHKIISVVVPLVQNQTSKGYIGDCDRL